MDVELNSAGDLSVTLEAMRHKVYEQKIVTENKRKLFACGMPFGTELALLPYHTVRTWSDSLVPLHKALLDLQAVWKDIGPELTPCPIFFTDEEVRKHEMEFERYTRYHQSIASLDDGARRWIFNSIKNGRGAKGQLG